MSNLIFVSVILLILTCEIYAKECPCADANLCKPLTVGPRKEFYLFTTSRYEADYSWDYLTTICLFPDLSDYDPQLLCKAHSKGVRIIANAVFPVDNLYNITAKKQWITSTLAFAQDNFFDGVNVDIEDAIPAGSPLASLLTELVQDLNDAFKAQIPTSIVTFDVAWAPSCIDVRCYDYAGLARATDFLVIMAYDEQSQIFGACKAGATSDYTYLQKGIKGYLDLGIPASKLVASFPWYGHDYTCLNPINATVCPLALKPWRGWPCTDLDTPELDYGSIINIFLPRSTSGRLWDPVSRSPYLNYIDTAGAHHQIWYDDPESLSYKSQWAKTQNVRGVSMYRADFLAYTTHPEQTAAMWDAMNLFFK